MTTARKLRIVLLLLVSALMLTLVMQNRAPVEAHFLWMSAELPVFALLGTTLLGGFVSGAVTVLLLTRRKRKRDALRASVDA